MNNPVEIFGELCLHQLCELESQSLQSAKRRSRRCLHGKNSRSFQQMLIHLQGDSWIPIHRQRGKGKSYTVLSGGLKVVFFNPNLKIQDVKELHSGDRFALYFDSGYWHTCYADEGKVLYLETMDGPYSLAATEWAEGGLDSLEALRGQVRLFQKGQGVE